MDMSTVRDMSPVAVVTQQTFRESVAASRRRKRIHEALALRTEADKIEGTRTDASPAVRVALAAVVIDLHNKARRLEHGSR